MFRLVNGKKEDADLWDAMLGDDESPDDWVVGKDAGPEPQPAAQPSDPAATTDDTPGAKGRRHRVLIDDNYHFMDEDARTTGPEFATYAEAVAWCQQFMENHLQELHKPGMGPVDLVAGYRGFGEDPWISPEPEGQHFSAWECAKEIAERVCAKARQDRLAGRGTRKPTR